MTCTQNLKISSHENVPSTALENQRRICLQDAAILPRLGGGFCIALCQAATTRMGEKKVNIEQRRNRDKLFCHCSNLSSVFKNLLTFSGKAIEDYEKNMDIGH